MSPRRRPSTGGKSTSPVRTRQVAEGMMLHDADGELLHAAPPPIVAELRYTVARMQLHDGKTGVPPRLFITSALSGEGVTFVCRSLASVLAHDAEQTVCVVDLNWWTGTRTDERSGVAEVVRGELSVDQALVATDKPRLSYLPAGSLPFGDRPLVARSVELQSVLDELGARYDHLLLDLPPVLISSEGLTLATYGEAGLMVVRQGVTPASHVRKALGHLEGTRILGIVMNGASSKIPPSILKRIPV